MIGKRDRHAAIRRLVAGRPVANQGELVAALAELGFHVEAFCGDTPHDTTFSTEVSRRALAGNTSRFDRWSVDLSKWAGEEVTVRVSTEHRHPCVAARRCWWLRGGSAGRSHILFGVFRPASRALACVRGWGDH